MYRRINPTTAQELPMRMLFQPAGDGLFLKACEADSWRGLVAALLDDPQYEALDLEMRLMHRLRLANDVALIAAVDGRDLRIGDRDAPRVINVHDDEALIRSLHKVDVVSLDPALDPGGGAGWLTSN